MILKNTGYDKPVIVIFANTAAMGYFNIEFCPMCGRKLV
nr:MAG TPA: Rad50 zinc hook motif [Bacteriophage sp.]